MRADEPVLLEKRAAETAQEARNAMAWTEKAVPLLTSAGPVLESPTPGLDLFTFRDQNCPAFAVACR